MKRYIWDEKTVKSATGGCSTLPWKASGISFDTRSLKRGDLFLAISGDRDGHEFIGDAFEKGAAAAMVSFVPKDIDKKLPLILVDDVKKGLTSLAEKARERSQAVVIGITGTAGKTSTKEIAAIVFRNFGKTHSSKKSFNNSLGCSITLATAPLDARYIIVEIGTNNFGEISELSQLVKPDYTIITEVSLGHLDGLKNLGGILREKASICEGQEKNGIALIPSDISKYSALEKEVAKFGSKSVSFGKKASSDFKILKSFQTYNFTKTDILLPSGKEISFYITAIGFHHVRNSVAILSLLSVMGLDIDRVLCALKSWHPLAGRGELTPLNFLKNGRRENFLLIDESYNANPTSIQSALDTLVNICSKVYKEKAFKVGSSRRIAVLGDMLEMGDNELREHIKIKDLAVMDKVDIVHCVGFRMQVLYNELPKSKRGLWTKTSHEMLVELVKKIKNGDIIVVKGSFSMNMNQITIGLKELEKVEM